MKTTEITNKKVLGVSKALEEVWEWKNEVYEKTKNMSEEDLSKYFYEGLTSAAKSINAILVRCDDGSYLME
jgi:hypothetical protein